MGWKEDLVPKLNEEERKLLLRAAAKHGATVDPDDWMNYRTISEFWNFEQFIVERANYQNNSSASSTIGKYLKAGHARSVPVPVREDGGGSPAPYFPKEDVLRITEEFGLNPELLGNKPMLPPNEEERQSLEDEGLNPNEWVSYRQLCEYLGLSYSYVTNLVSDGDFPQPLSIGSWSFFHKRTIIGAYTSQKAEKLEREAEVRTLGLYDATSKKLSGGRTQAHYLRTLAREVSLEDWAAIVRLAVKDAKGGDRHARKWLTDYLIGTPIKRIAAAVQHTDTSKFSDAERSRAIANLILGGDMEDEDENGDDPGIVEGYVTNSKEIG